MCLLFYPAAWKESPEHLGSPAWPMAGGSVSKRPTVLPSSQTSPLHNLNPTLCTDHRERAPCRLSVSRPSRAAPPLEGRTK